MSVVRVYELFEQVVARDRFGHHFGNQSETVPADLPASYKSFVAAQNRYLPSNWELYSFFGHDRMPLEVVRRRMLAEGVSERWLVFGKTGDEDFLAFDRHSPTRGAVIWCDAERVGALDGHPYYARSFYEMIARVTASMASAELKAAKDVLDELKTLGTTARHTGEAESS